MGDVVPSERPSSPRPALSRRLVQTVGDTPAEKLPIIAREGRPPASAGVRLSLSQLS